MMAGSGNSLFPALNSPQRQGNATGSGRNKVALSKGRSLMDWIRLGNSGADLTSVGGRLIRVTPEELKKHNTPDDCWMAIGGAVYNITQYCQFHPGGIDEIMKGAGIEATQLFNEVHRWVNYEAMLKKCLVGKLVSGGPLGRAPQYGNLLAPPRAMGTHLSTVNKPQVADQLQGGAGSSGIPFVKPPPPSDKPRYDYFQNEGAVKLSIYTRTPGVCAEHLILERPGGNISVSLYLPSGKIYKLHIAPSHPLLASCVLKSVKTIGKIEIDFPKAERGVKWTKLGEFLADHDSLIGQRGVTSYIDCTVTSIDQVTHDTRLYTISLPESYHMSVPLGCHIKIKADILGMEIERSYTPACRIDNITDVSPNVPGCILELLIKIYEDGALTQHINTLKPGDSLPIGHYEGRFTPSQLEPYPSVLLLAAGTGFTPMTKLISHCIMSKKSVHLVFFNKTEKDIVWRRELDSLTKSAQSLFSVTHVISQPDSSWSGFAGRLTEEMLEGFLPAETRVNTFVAACGPIPFMRLCEQFFTNLKYDKAQVHSFQE